MPPKSTTQSDDKSFPGQVSEAELSGKVVATVPPARIPDEMLAQIGKGTGDVFADAMAIAEGFYGEVVDASDVLGTGFAILDDKSKLIGKPLLFITWRQNSGDHGNFVSVALVTAEKIDGQQKFIINDGSTGLYSQLVGYTLANNGKSGGLRVKGGLRESTYATCKGCEKPRPSDVEVCENELKPGVKCGNTEAGRGVGNTYYVDLSA